MNPRRRHVLRRIWFTVGGVFAALVIALAVLMALGQLLLPLAAHYPNRVAHMISQRLGRPVSFASMQGYWQPSGPLLVLHKVRIGGRDGRPVLTLPTARVKLDFGALVEPSRHWVNLRLSGLRLQLQRGVQGRWHVVGFGVAGQGRTHQLTLDDLPGNVWLDDLELEIDDVPSGRHYRIRAGPLRLSNGGGTLRFAGRLRRGASRQALHVAGELRDGGRTGRLYLAATDADLGRMLRGANVDGYAVLAGQGDVALWLAWQHGGVRGVTLHADLGHVKVKGPAGTLKAPQLRGLVQYRHVNGVTRVLFAPGAGGAARADIRGGATGLQVVARAHNLDSGAWLQFGALVPGLPAALGHWLAAAAPTVHLASAHLDWSRRTGLHALAVHFDHLGLRAAGARPGVDHAYGVLRGDAGAISLHLPPQPMTLDFARVFRKPLVFTRVGGDLVMRHAAHGWQIATPDIDFTAKGLAGQVRGRVRMPAGGGAPFLDLYADLTHGKVIAAKPFWPINIMPPQVVKWLDHGLAGGTVNEARVIMHGNVADWPFTNHKGRFEAQADIAGAALDYDPKWPHARDVAVKVDFVDNGLLAEVSNGAVHGVKIDHAVASIPDLGRPELILQASGAGTLDQLLDFVRATPIGAPHAKILDGLQVDGQADYGFSMVLPLSARASEPFTLAGSVQLHDADVDAAAWQMQLAGVNGALAFDNHGFVTHGLTATFRGRPVDLQLAVGPQTGHADWPLAVNMRGRFSLAQLAQGRARLASLAQLGSGSAPFNLEFHIDNQAANAVHSKEVLRVRSNLRGISLNLPAPLAKPAQALWPLDFELGLPIDGANLRVILGNRLFARARLPADQQSGAVQVRLGGLAPAQPMPASGIEVRGRVQRLDVSGWVHYALSAAGGVNAGMPRVDIDVTGDDTLIAGQQFNKLRIQLHPTPTQWELAVDGVAIQGKVTVPVHDIGKRGIVARFDRLYWPSPKHGHAAAVPAPAASTTVAAALAAAADAGIAPSSLPPLHAWIGDLRFGDAHLGQARLETWPTAHGMHIDMLRTESKSVHVSASGNWTGTASASQTRLAMEFSAANLGHMLAAFGYEGFISGGQTHAKFDATWPGAPWSFALANVEGTLDVDIGEGRIPEVKPGVGRLFGLMSIAELPRHLTVDFGNIFSKGFNFHSIKGHFRFHDGNAWTQDLRIDGLGADISVSGRVGLRAHDYDQYVLAIPHIGNTLPIVGALFGGPVGAAAGWAVQGLLGKGLNHAASARYHISGPWKNPKITLVSKHVPKPTPQAARPASVTPPARASSARPSPQPAAPVSAIPPAHAASASAASQPAAPVNAAPLVVPGSATPPAHATSAPAMPSPASPTTTPPPTHSLSTAQVRAGFARPGDFPPE